MALPDTSDVLNKSRTSMKQNGRPIHPSNRPVVARNPTRLSSNMKQELQFLQSIPLFDQLSTAALRELEQSIIKRKVAQSEILFREGDPGEVLYIVKAGQVRIYVSGSHTETSVILFGRPGDIFGELAIVDGLPRSASATALEDTIVYTLERTTFRTLMRRYPQLALNFMQLLSVRVRYNTRKVNSLASMSISSRLARMLLTLAQDYGKVHEDGVLINSSLNQTELASLIGATRESTNKTLSLFRKDGLIRKETGYIIILDPEALRGRVVES